MALWTAAPRDSYFGMKVVFRVRESRPCSESGPWLDVRATWSVPMSHGGHAQNA